MNDLVTLTSQRLDAEIYMTGDVIAEYVGIKAKSVNELIRRYKSDLEEFRILPFQKEEIQGRGQPRKIWHLNEDQAMLLITYLDNTKPVREFKKALIKQFSAMKRILIERQAKYELGKEFNKSFATAVKDSRIDMHGHQYSTLHCLAYKMALGVDVTKLRKSRHIKAGEIITTYLSAYEAQAVALINQRIKTLLDVGLNYQEIKQALQIKGVIYRIELQLPAKASVK
ncbi:Rha family transcriptional regulator [Lactiplantibacillus plantarum]|uniref:Rha family transcriptional regulator n=1 Tax=Lactiplantibacillus plantarum TaxID=1590 RepID=UPI001BA5810E|nr:Rha family transcriptional regulator [Lactiplantibacillus plantarum]MBS0937409.1 Rha family transcriptional regulator [Lactiplantibacillus plantarum]MBS0945547.1 Rha family transcriptional regulator [Lactiplantibacillus plantarum]